MTTLEVLKAAGMRPEKKGSLAFDMFIILSMLLWIFFVCRISDRIHKREISTQAINRLSKEAKP